jgi:hypothetical protein
MVRRKTPKRRAGLSPWAFLAAGVLIGAAMTAGGILVLVHGSGYEGGGSGVATGDVTAVGISLIAMGLVAVGLTVTLTVLKRREPRKTRKRR